MWTKISQQEKKITKKILLELFFLFLQEVNLDLCVSFVYNWRRKQRYLQNVKKLFRVSTVSVSIEIVRMLAKYLKHFKITSST